MWIKFLPQIDRLSFWLGFLAGCLIWWLVRKIAPFYREIREKSYQQFQAIRQAFAKGTENRYRHDILFNAQRMHLAAPFFALHEIVIPPRIIPSQSHLDGQMETLTHNLVKHIIPSLHDWPEVNSAYHTPTLSLAEALRHGANLLLLGYPGYGKTVALAHLITQMVLADSEAAHLADKLAVYVHCADLDYLLLNETNPLDLIINVISKQVSLITAIRLPSLIKNRFRSGQVLLLLDGLDELTPEEVRQATKYISILLQHFPETQVVVATSPDYTDGLMHLGLVPVIITLWNKQQQTMFINKWCERWNEINNNKVDSQDRPDSRLITSWLQSQEGFFTPLEHTLSVWAALAGDSLGPTVTNGIEAYFRRMIPGFEKKRTAFEHLATHFFSALLESSPEERNLLITQSNPKAKSLTSRPIPLPSKRTLHTGIKQGILIERSNHRLYFIHPIFSGYLVAESIAAGRYKPKLDTVSESSLIHLTLELLSARPEAQPYFEQIITHLRSQNSDLLLDNKILNGGHWLRYAHISAVWRSQFLKMLAELLLNTTRPMKLRFRALACLVASRDSGIPLLLRRLLTHPYPDIRQLAALGLGLLNDKKSISDLSKLTTDPVSEVRLSACFALGIIQDIKALETVMTILTNGDEQLRQAAAEILANHPVEGYAALREASNHNDIMTRRAAMFGLAKINENWSIEILEKAQMEDSQWVVRNVAEESLQWLRSAKPETPKPIPPLKQIPWLITFAGKHGEGIDSDESIRDWSLVALKEGEKQHKYQALETICYLPTVTKEIIASIYRILYDRQDNLQEAAYNTLLLLEMSGIELPPSTEI